MATSKVYKQILLATDLSKRSDCVARRAVMIAKTVKAKLSVLHVVGHTPIAYAGEFSIPIDAEYETIIEKQAKSQLEKLGKKYNIPKKSQYLGQGSIKFAVLEAAKKIKADLIVVGTHDQEGLDFILGSQANAILQAAQCDVLVVRTK